MTPTRIFIPAILLLLCTGCTQSAPTPPTAQTQAPQQNTAAARPFFGIFSDAACSGQAQRRMALYDKPDAYPITDKERQDAYAALYDACMREHNTQTTGAGWPGRSSATDASQLATLSPATGGNHPAALGNSAVSANSLPGGATVIMIGSNGGTKDITSQLSSISPSSGGGGAASSNTATVVLMQTPPASGMLGGMATAKPIPAASPVAIPLPPPSAFPSPPPPAALPIPAAMAARDPIPDVPPLAPPPPATHSLSSSTQDQPPSLAGADAVALGNTPPVVDLQDSNKELQNILEK